LTITSALYVLLRSGKARNVQIYNRISRVSTDYKIDIIKETGPSVLG